MEGNGRHGGRRGGGEARELLCAHSIAAAKCLWIQNWQRELYGELSPCGSQYIYAFVNWNYASIRYLVAVQKCLKVDEINLQHSRL